MADSNLPQSIDLPLRTLLPPAVATQEWWGAARDFDLTQSELITVERCVAKRRREFATGRFCARAALRHFGVRSASINVNRDRSPAWPEGFVGSITHTQGYCGAAVARSALWLGIGIDAELHSSLQPELWPHVLQAEELDWLYAQSIESRMAMAAVIFSAKESFYKCQYPVSKRWLDFHDVSIEIAKESFVVRFPVDIDGFKNPVRGRYVQTGGIVVTALAVPR